MQLRTYRFVAGSGSFVWFKNLSEVPVHLIDISKDGNEVRAPLQQDSCDVGRWHGTYKTLFRYPCRYPTAGYIQMKPYKSTHSATAHGVAQCLPSMTSHARRSVLMLSMCLGGPAQHLPR